MRLILMMMAIISPLMKKVNKWKQGKKMHCWQVLQLVKWMQRNSVPTQKKRQINKNFKAEYDEAFCILMFDLYFSIYFN